MNLLIITANRAEIAKHLMQLKILNFDVTVVDSLENAQKAMTQKKFGVAMLSWSLEDIDLKATYRMLTEERGLPCLIFTEDRSRKATNLLLTSGIRNVIYPPLSAHGIHRRIQLLVRTQAEGLKKLPTLRPEAAPTEARKQRRRTLEATIAEVLKSLPPTPAFTGAKAGVGSCVLLTEIQWPESQGYLLTAVDKPFREREFLDVVIKAAMQNLEKSGDALGSALKPHEVEMAFKVFKKWASTRAECVLTERHAATDLMLAYADTDTLPSMTPTPNPEYYWVDVNRWLSTKAKLPFDIYVHLPENNKYVLYIRKGSAVGEQNMSRLSKIGSDRCFIKVSEGMELFKHLFLNPDIHPSTNQSGW